MPGRCFLAIGLPAAPVRIIERSCRAFRDAAPLWAGEKWVRPELLHITLRFIGKLPDGSLPDLLAALRETCATHPRHELRLTGVRAVPAPRCADMLWATWDGDLVAVTALARDISAALTSSIGLASDHRAFTAHTTLVRARGRRAAPESALHAADEVMTLGKEADRSMSVPHVTLYESTLGSGGPLYTVLGSAPLASEPRTGRIDTEQVFV